MFLRHFICFNDVGFSGIIQDICFNDFCILSINSEIFYLFQSFCILRVNSETFLVVIPCYDFFFNSRLNLQSGGGVGGVRNLTPVQDLS